MQEVWQDCLGDFRARGGKGLGADFSGGRRVQEVCRGLATGSLPRSGGCVCMCMTICQINGIEFIDIHHTDTLELQTRNLSLDTNDSLDTTNMIAKV